MGDGAMDALNGWVRAGMPQPKPKYRKPRVSCLCCKKEVHGYSGLMQHINAKHEKKAFSYWQIDLMHNKELLGCTLKTGESLCY